MHSRECIIAGMYSLECIPKIKDPNTDLMSHMTYLYFVYFFNEIFLVNKKEKEKEAN